MSKLNFGLLPWPMSTHHVHSCAHGFHDKPEFVSRIGKVNYSFLCFNSGLINYY